MSDETSKIGEKGKRRARITWKRCYICGCRKRGEDFPTGGAGCSDCARKQQLKKDDGYWVSTYNKSNHFKHHN